MTYIQPHGDRNASEGAAQNGRETVLSSGKLMVEGKNPGLDDVGKEIMVARATRQLHACVGDGDESNRE